MKRNTVVSIEGREFRINGKPTYEGRMWNGHKISGLLMNSRMVQGIFDDRNDETRPLWNYPDGPWDAERNTREFIEAMPTWRRHGLLAFDICLQGGSPQGYSKNKNHPWHNSAFDGDGSLRADYLARLERIIDRADELGMAIMLCYFYFGQAHRMDGEAAFVRGADNATDWLISKGYTNVLVEVANECNAPQYAEILQPPRAHELIDRVQKRSAGRVNTPAGRLLASISYWGGHIPGNNVAEVSDFLLLHGNGVSEPDRIREMVDQTRALPDYDGQPIVFNEDDHFDFDKPESNMIAAVSKYAGWGYFDFRMPGEGFEQGYQSVPVSWGLSSDRKRGFFKLLAEITGS